MNLGRPVGLWGAEPIGEETDDRAWRVEPRIEDALDGAQPQLRAPNVQRRFDVRVDEEAVADPE